MQKSALNFFLETVQWAPIASAYIVSCLIAGSSKRPLPARGRTLALAIMMLLKSCSVM